MSTADDAQRKKALVRAIRQNVKAKVPFTVLIGNPSNADLMHAAVDEADVDKEIEIFTDPQMGRDSYYSMQRSVFEESYFNPPLKRSKKAPKEASKPSTGQRAEQLLAELAECFVELEGRVKELERRSEE